MSIQTYDPQKVSLSLGDITIVQYSTGTFIKASRNEDAFTLTVSADGTGARTRNANRSGRFEFTLLGSSPSNDDLQALAVADEQDGSGVRAAMVKDGSGTAVARAANAWVVKVPDLERAKELGEVTWIVETDLLNLTQGGTNQGNDQ